MTDDSPELETKAALRLRVRESRQRRSAAVIAALSHQAEDRLFDFLIGLHVQSVALFLGSSHEPQTLALINRLLERGIEVFAPHSLANGELAWSALQEPVTVIDGPWGIPEAATSDTDRVAQITPDVVVVPAAMVDVHGTRLGWGKGYYDRFLVGLASGTPVIALVFDDEVAGNLPRESHDVPVTHVVTPQSIRTVPFDAD